MKTPYQKIVVKVGSNVLSQENGAPDLYRMKSLVQQISALSQAGLEVILVSSGAVAFGRSYGLMMDAKDEIARRQVWASLGQVKMIREYQKFFEAENMLCSQVLVTRDDFRSRRHYLNIKQCITQLTAQGILPIINENDAVSVTELMFTDNDELAGLVAAMVGADALIILSNVAGVYSGNPREADSVLVEKFHPDESISESILIGGRSSFGRGGMKTKVYLARKTARLGIAVHIADGTHPDILRQVLEGTTPHTHFIPSDTKDGRKKWIAHAQHFTAARVTINEGAVKALQSSHANSLLPVGITAINGNFSKGDIIELVNTAGQIIALGRAQYASELAQERIGENHQKPLVHYDYLYVV
ncbi:glutamate 5-kinase [Membranicola marinus]|uniref:Glutamate 5-kinase n=1 Tax=Membranihabitans marinus TaxID=1227546 RepID=A0A953HY59_9BACT|nr:glutamate 5-kinase [Membranihabitans marinus]MBY5959943.1 glutamate 5-kinase [Membranihabitans marinus]